MMFFYFVQDYDIVNESLIVVYIFDTNVD